MLVRSCTAVASANALTILDHLEACRNSRNHVPQVKKFGVCSSSSRLPIGSFHEALGTAEQN